jgi:hypothetical protein
MKSLAKAKVDLSQLPNVPLGRQTIDGAIKVIEDARSTPEMVQAERAKVPAARDACLNALTSKSNTIGNLRAHVCVALADYAERRDDALRCRVDWIDFLGGKFDAPKEQKEILGDAWEANAKVLIAQQNISGGMDAYGRATRFSDTSARLFNLAQLEEKYPDRTADAIAHYDTLSGRSDSFLDERKKYEVLRNLATLVSKTNASAVDKRKRWENLLKFKRTPEGHLQYARTFLDENMSGDPNPDAIKALVAATEEGSVADGEADQSNARSIAWYYRAVFAARSAASREAWATVVKYASNGSAAPRAARLKCIATVASGNVSDASACQSSTSTAEQNFLLGVMRLRSSQFLPRCNAESSNQPCLGSSEYTNRWLGLVGDAKRSFSDGRNAANNQDVLDWLEQGQQNSPRLVELLKAGETIAQDWQTNRPGKNCKSFPRPAGLDPKAETLFGQLDLLNCEHK